MVGALALIGFGTSVFGAYNQYEAGQAQAQALREQAELDMQRANEYIFRTEQNIKARRKSAEKIIGAQKVSLAESGVDVGTGVSLDMLEDSYMALAEEERLIMEDAEYQAMSIRKGAEATKKQAADVSRASTINAFTSLLGSSQQLSKFA